MSIVMRARCSRAPARRPPLRGRLRRWRRGRGCSDSTDPNRKIGHISMPRRPLFVASTECAKIAERPSRLGQLAFTSRATRSAPRIASAASANSAAVRPQKSNHDRSRARAAAPGSSPRATPRPPVQRGHRVQHVARPTRRSVAADCPPTRRPRVTSSRPRPDHRGPRSPELVAVAGGARRGEHERAQAHLAHLGA